MKKDLNVWTILLGIVLIIAGFAIESAIAMWLWNYVICTLFVGAQPINFWVGCGIMFVINFAIGLFRKND